MALVVGRKFNAQSVDIYVQIVKVAGLLADKSIVVFSKALILTYFTKNFYNR